MTVRGLSRKMHSIRWNQHSGHLTHSVSELYRNSELTDCILDLEDKSIHVHRIILAACSPFFKNLLKAENGITLIPIKDVTYKDMKLILDFIYYGEALVHITDVISLMKTAEFLEMTSLKDCVCHCFQMELSCKDTSTRSMNDRSYVPCTNLICHDTKNLLQEHFPHDPAFLSMGDEVLGFKSQSIHVHAIGDSAAKYLDNFQDVSGKFDEDQSMSSALNTCDSINENTNQGKENVNGDLVPFTFVAVPEIKDPNKAHQDDTMCDRSVLKDPLEDYSSTLDVTVEGSVKKECTFVSDLLVKKEHKDENDVPESMTEDVLISDKFTHSLLELSVTKCNPIESCGREISMDRNPDVTCSDTFGSEGCDSGETHDTEILLESICKVSGADVKDEKVFDTGQCLNHILGENAGSGLWEPKREVNEEDSIASASNICISLGLEKQNIIPAKYETPAPTPVQTAFCGERKKIRKKSMRSDSSSHSDETLLSKRQTKSQPLDLMDPVHLQLKPEFRVTDAIVENVETYSTENMNFSCSICCKSFRQMRHLRIHMRTHTPEKQFQLRVRKRTDRNGKLARNIPTYPSAKYVDCPICHKTLVSKYYMPIHLRIHSGHKPFQCEICKKSFSFKGSLNVHMKTHTDHKPFKCEMCNKTFSQKRYLAQHISTHAGERPYECEICKRAFFTRRSLKSHMFIHTGHKGDRPFECAICKKSFPVIRSLNVHMQTHTGHKSFECEVCKMTFRRKYDLKVHIRKHTGDRPFECAICKKSYFRKCRLIVHMRIHTGDRPYKCAICKKSFSDKVILVRHIKTHSDLKPVQCDICKKSFTQKIGLKNHMVVHTGHKPFECETCEKSFSRKARLTEHMRVHTGEKPYECVVCKKSFTMKYYLNCHMQTHTDERPYECEICKKSFKYKQYFSKHFGLHASEKIV